MVPPLLNTMSISNFKDQVLPRVDLFDFFEKAEWHADPDGAALELDFGPIDTSNVTNVVLKNRLNQLSDSHVAAIAFGPDIGSGDTIDIVGVELDGIRIRPSFGLGDGGTKEMPGSYIRFDRILSKTNS